MDDDSNSDSEDNYKRGVLFIKIYPHALRWPNLLQFRPAPALLLLRHRSNKDLSCPRIDGGFNE
jgi:hypothetical protein